MSDYTPTLEELREVWGDRAVSREGRSTTRWRELSVVAIAEFDRAIAKVRTDAKVEALREAVSDFESHIGVGEFAELSQRGPMPWGHLQDAWEHQGPYMDWLRTRADELAAS